MEYMNNGNCRRDNIGMTVRQPGSALILLFSLFAFFLILTPILTGWLGAIIKKPVAALRIAMVVQDLLVFILPAIGFDAPSGEIDGGRRQTKLANAVTIATHVIGLCSGHESGD